MNSEGVLWDLVYAVLPREPSDPSPQATLNRLANVYFRREPAPSFDDENCTIREELLSPRDLALLERRHDRDTPRHAGGAIIIISYEGRRVVIDGNCRVNRWIGEQSHQPRLAIVIEPRLVAAAKKRRQARVHT